MTDSVETNPHWLPGAQPSAAPLTLEESALRLGRYAWVERRLFEVLGEWSAIVPEPGVKERLAVHSRKHAWHAQLWEERLPEVGHLDPGLLTTPPDDRLAAVIDALASPSAAGQTIEKVVGAYRVVLPRVIAAYGLHLRIANPASDAPVARWLKVILRDELDDWQEGELLIESLLVSREDVDRAMAHHARLERLMVKAGGVSGTQTLDVAPP